MELGLNGKVALISGGTEGIGRASAITLAREGAKVVICARGQEKLDATAAEITKAGGEVLAISADMSKPEDCERFINEAVKRFGRIDILLHNAGTSARGEFLEVNDATWAADSWVYH
jgi:NAD(P)-dependent dehydrogenase (short-subunit alcohol dehydrogenase family)